MRRMGIFLGVSALVVAIAAIGARSTRFDETPQLKVRNKTGIPHQINYQGYLTDNSENAITDTLEMTFSIWNDPEVGSLLWDETQNDVAVIDGLFNVLLGSVDPIPSSVFSNPICWLQTEIEGEILSPRKELVSIGYAFRADTADHATNAINANWAYNSEHAIHADTAAWAAGTGPVIYADTAWFAHNANSANYAASMSVPCTLSGSVAYPNAILTVENTGASDGIKVTNAGYDGVSVDSAGDDGVQVTNAGFGFYVQNATYNGLFVENAGCDGVYVGSADSNGVYVRSAGGDGFYVFNAGCDGFRVDSAGDDGVQVTNAGFGFYVQNATYNGLFVENAGCDGVYVGSADSNGVYVRSAGGDGFYVFNAGCDGFRVDSAGDDGVYVGNAGYDGVSVDSAGGDGFYVFNAGDDGVYVGSAGGDGVWADAKQRGGVFYNNSTGINNPALQAKNRATNGSDGRIANLYSANFLRFHFDCDGTAYADVGWSTFKKNGKGEYKSYSAVESPYKEIIAHGTGKLVNGQVYISFDNSFSEFVSSDVTTQITVTPKSGTGLYVPERSTRGFTVKSWGGDPNCEFDWIAIGREKGHEQRTVLHDLDEEMRLAALEEERERAEHERKIAERERKRDFERQRMEEKSEMRVKRGGKGEERREKGEGRKEKREKGSE